MDYYTWKKTIPVLLVMLSVASFQVMAVASQQSSRRYKPLQDTSRPLKGIQKGPTYSSYSIRDDDVYFESDSSASEDDESVEKMQKSEENSKLLLKEKEFKDGRGHSHYYHGPYNQRRPKDKHRNRSKNQDRDRKRMISNGDERDSKRTETAPDGSTSNNAKMYPRTPVVLPIVTSQMVEESESEYAKVISTHKQPFHFHIPIVKDHEASAENSKKWDELEAEAKKYKSQLNFDKEAILASVTDVPMMKAVAGRSAAWTRMVRDSPVLDFLNLAVVLGHEHEEADIVGDKRSVVHLQPTDEVLQELVGDDDDLLSIHSSRKDLKSNQHPNKIRKKRGLFSWIKSKLGFGKKTTTTTTTTRRPPPPPPASHSESDEPATIRVTEDNKQKMKKHKKKRKYFKLQTDSQGDTEVDSLLPPALRRSYYYKNVKHGDDKDDYHYDNVEENQNDHESKEAPSDNSNEKVSAEKKPSKSRRRKLTGKHSSSSSSSEEK